ncbi:MAG: acetamidase/formamidase family protein [Sphingomonadales bacterium]|nr:acetamidase/formamidase family protein [Sphingomonadales bacterium]
MTEQPGVQAEEGTDRIGRRDLMRWAGLAGTAAALAPSLAQAAPPAKVAAVFDRRHVGRTHVLPSTPQTVRVGNMDPAVKPVLEIESGDVVHYPDTWVNWANEAKYQMPTAEREKIPRRYPNGPTSLVGPVAIKGAEPGDAIECRMIRLKPIDWGWNSAIPGMGALPTDFSEPYLHYFRFDKARRFAEFSPGVRIALAPIQGVIAAQPAGPDPVSALRAGAYGGCVQLPDLVEGTSLFIAAEVPGANIWTGDSHAVQGDGVVNQTGIETAMEDLRIQYILHKGAKIGTPIAETPTHWIVAGYADTLDGAVAATLRHFIDWLSGATGMSRLDVYALASLSGSVRLTQYANQIGGRYKAVSEKAVHIRLPKNLFDAGLQGRIAQSLRPRV